MQEGEPGKRRQPVPARVDPAQRGRGSLCLAGPGALVTAGPWGHLLGVPLAAALRAGRQLGRLRLENPARSPMRGLGSRVRPPGPAWHWANRGPTRSTRSTVAQLDAGGGTCWPATG